MTVSHVSTVAFVGIEAREVDVQVHMADASGENAGRMSIVGLPDKAVAESRERVRAALHAIGLALPFKRITVNLSPADLPKEGSHYDVPIALGLLAAMSVLPSMEMAGCLAMGELSLDGAIVPVAGVLPAAIKALEVGRTFICPEAAGPEAAWADGLQIVAAPTLVALVNHLKGVQVLAQPRARMADETGSVPDLRDVKGQEMAKRALEVAAAGGHNLLMIGPPGAGKSMLAARLPGLLPDLAPAEALEVSMIQSVAGLLRDGRLVTRPPFREPNAENCMAALVGGGPRGRPGEISLAHGGVLFLDELPEFDVKVLDALRQPLEAGALQIARGTHSAEFPARFQLVAAMNPCPCGYAGLPGNRCACSVERIRRYQARVSGPIRDRIDLQVEVLGPCDPHRQAQDHLHHNPRALLQNMLAAHGLNATEVNSASIRALAQSCRKRQHARQAGLNAHLAAGALLRHAALDDAGRRFAAGLSRLGYSHRAMHGLMRVARSIADMLLEDSVGERALALAAQLRRVQAFPPHPAHYEPAAAFRAPATD